MRLRGLSAGLLAVLTVMTALQSASVHAKMDILEQIYDNKGLSTPVVPRSYNEAITKLLKKHGVEFTDLSPQLQRSLLWSAGWVRAIPATDSGSSDSSSFSSSAAAEENSDLYVQVYVECGRTMSGVFLTATAFDDDSVCKLKSCKGNVIAFTMDACEPSFLESKTLCALSPKAETDWSTLAQRPGPLWSVDGQVGDNFDPQLFQYGNTSVAQTDNTTIFMLTQRDSWNMGDHSCPNSAQFITPCREVKASAVDDTQEERAWCVPEVELIVTLLLDAEVGSASSSSATGANTSLDNSSSGVSTAVVVVLAVLLALLVVACIVLFCMLRRSRHRTGGPNGQRDGRYFVRAGSFDATGQQGPGGNSMQLDNMGRPTVGGMQYVSNNGQHKMSFETVMQVEAVNEGFRQRSAVLAAFCDDQELMLKRVAFAGLAFRQQLSSGSNGEVWRGEYEGQQVAIKCTVAAASAATAATAAATSSHDSSTATSSSIVSALTDSELRALEDFTKEIRMAAFLEHPNIVRFVGLSWRTLPDLCMISEFVALGDLAHFLASKESTHLTWKDEKLPIAADIANALVYLHSLSPLILHRDLKSLNVLLTENLEAKVSDFGLSRERNFDETMTSGVGTLLWTAPEVLRGEQYSEKADIYSFGVVLSELDTCLPPFSLNQTSSKGKKKVMDWVPLIASGEATPQFGPSCPPAIRELATQCLDSDPNNRPAAMQIVYMLRSKIRLTLS